jgi:hypothetical protein
MNPPKVAHTMLKFVMARVGIVQCGTFLAALQVKVYVTLPVPKQTRCVCVWELAIIGQLNGAEI